MSSEMNDAVAQGADVGGEIGDGFVVVGEREEKLGVSVAGGLRKSERVRAFL